MMFHSPQLKVVLVTVHVPLRDVPSLMTGDLLDQTIVLTRRRCGLWEWPRRGWRWRDSIPTLASRACIGREDDEVLAPAVQRRSSVA